MPEREAVDETPLPGSGVVYLFDGLTLPGDTYFTSGTYRITQMIRARGVRAQIDYTTDWEEVTERLLRADPGASKLPIALFGYSSGAGSAAQMARRLGENGILVQTLVVIEAAFTQYVPGNVARAVHLYGSDSLFSFASPIEPAPDFHGSLENVPLSERLAAGAEFDHWSFSRSEVVHTMVVDELLDSSGVRRRWPPA
ncbi:hypothetical protein D3874_13260 [Oleomonas cavernae]|uniref:Thioesterase domain-containing protein n=1 Tax=Oleomonas cavernae TaxID=2320859 RepID=A0A418WD08_9PROT|nr:hypothetical protein [Oleomonas cavernae]RJF87874.1 hypothetical protein D3874_13260 [Oleomonas cavernae]